jgi:predicted DCC family thiol-disulfide oxidoreductase YuxK
MAATALYDGYCSFCKACKRVVDLLDWFRAITWIPFQTPEARRFGIDQQLLEQRMYVVTESKRWSGFAAWKQILLRLPALYLGLAASALLWLWSLIPWLLFFAPVFEPIGEHVYDWIARNRHRVPGSTCEREP